MVLTEQRHQQQGINNATSPTGETHVRLLYHLIDAAIKDDVGMNDPIIGAMHHRHVGAEAVQKQPDPNRGRRQVVNRDRLVHNRRGKDRVWRRNTKWGCPPLKGCSAPDTSLAERKRRTRKANREASGVKTKTSDAVAAFKAALGPLVAKEMLPITIFRESQSKLWRPE